LLWKKDKSRIGGPPEYWGIVVIPGKDALTVSCDKRGDAQIASGGQQTVRIGGSGIGELVFIGHGAKIAKKKVETHSGAAPGVSGG
jgi:hypothetical protein